MNISLRYHEKAGCYYMQIQTEEYTRMDRKLHRLQRQISYLREEKHQTERVRLQQICQECVQAKRQAQFYVEIAETDIPEGKRIRPIQQFYGRVIQASPEKYQELLYWLNRYGKAVPSDADKTPEKVKAEL